jgi:hypothetical protein
MMTEQERKERDKQFLIEGVAHDVIVMLMESNPLTMEQAMDTLFNSKTFEKLEDENTGLYYQSPVYIMDMLASEKPGLKF